MERGTGWVSRFGGYVTGLPDPGRYVPLHVRLEPSSPDRAGMQTECWERRFGASKAMTSRLQAKDGMLVETIGAVRMWFRLEETDAGIRWHASAGTLWTWFRMPRSWLTGISATESEVDGQYAFEVRVCLPLVGLVINYHGTLATADPGQVKA